jgi:hypothetical protein
MKKSSVAEAEDLCLEQQIRERKIMTRIRGGNYGLTTSRSTLQRVKCERPRRKAGINFFLQLPSCQGIKSESRERESAGDSF